MKPRTCNIFVYITNDQGMTSRYSLRPLPAEALGAFVAGFRLCNTSKQPSPLYAVCLAADGQVSCDCPAHNFAGRCKHAERADRRRRRPLRAPRRPTGPGPAAGRACSTLPRPPERSRGLPPHPTPHPPLPPQGGCLTRLAALWRWLWTEAVALAAASVLPSRDALRVEEWCLRRRQPRPRATASAEGDTPASVQARIDALARLYRQLHTSAPPPPRDRDGAANAPRFTLDPVYPTQEATNENANGRFRTPVDPDGPGPHAPPPAGAAPASGPDAGPPGDP